jgi:hypothetical protein
MPQLLNHIDKICRDKKRDVLFLRFDDPLGGKFPTATRKKIVSWLSENAIPYQDCVGYFSNSGYMSADESIYLDIPYDLDNALYQKVADYLEDTDCVIKHKGVEFLRLTYESAYKIAEE